MIVGTFHSRMREVFLLSLYFLFTCLTLPGRAEGHTLSISLMVPRPLLEQPMIRLAVDDALVLLGQGFPSVRIALNDNRAAIRLQLPQALAVPSDGDRSAAAQAYGWTSSVRGQDTVLTLSATSTAAVCNGLYGLLQERLGYRFIHPRQTIVPRHTAWPLPRRFTWRAAPRFASRGFHLHTLHPVELTTQLHEPDYPGALEDLKQYVDWLARNGQNRVQFFLLRGVDRERWPPHAVAFVSYAHARGIAVGVEISLAMLQQQAFQAVKLFRPLYRRQIDRSLAWLFQVPWDFLTLESSAGEHLPRLDRLAPSLRNHLAREVTGRYGARFYHATHVIRSDAGGDNGSPPSLADLSSEYGLLVHTVMCYGVSEEEAPVYGNRNQRFMLKLAEREARQRETWYWPESSYWVAFDNSVPQLLLPYLSARYRDMAVMEGLGVTGHLTFTSGWEWGYWLMDWSIARWSWSHMINGRQVVTSPISPLADLFPDRRLQRLWAENLALQERWLKKGGLLRYTAALTPFSELPWPFNKPFQPEPPFRYSRLLEESGDQGMEKLVERTVADLDDFSHQQERLASELGRNLVGFAASAPSGPKDVRMLGVELERALMVTALRARHRALTIKAIHAQGRLKKGARPGSEALDLLAAAAAVRVQALQLVREQEAGYRYPVELVARRRPDLTAYGFGYLYPVSGLFFWQREEEQARRLRFDALFMNLWDFRRTVGLDSLFY